MKKTCIKCKIEKDIEEFGFYEPGRRRNTCKKCKIIYNKKYLKDNPEKKKQIYENRIPNNKEYRKKNKERRNDYNKKYLKDNPEKRRTNKLRSRYGININDYNNLLEKQKGKCKICGGSSSGRKGNMHLAVDHCHNTGKVRGLLCYKCNSGLGMFVDDINILEKAIIYLKENKNETCL